MLRRLLVPIAATALLAGCVATTPYGYRGEGQGDYYYGAPSVQYRYHEMYPGYGDPYYGPYRSGLSVWGSYGYYGNPYYGSPYGGGYYGNPYYGNPYYGSPYYGNPYYRGYPNGYPRHTHRPGPDGNNGANNGGNDGTSAPDGGPWRNLDAIARRRRVVDETGGGSAPAPSMPQPQPQPQFQREPEPQFVPAPRPAMRPMPRMDEGASDQVVRRPGQQDD